MARKFNAQNHIAALNLLRIETKGHLFTSKVVRREFRNCGIPSNALFWAVFSNSGLVQKIDNDLYCFVDPEKPIHFSRLDEIYKHYKEKSSTYHNKWICKKRQKDTTKSEEIIKAIRLLQDNGFVVSVGL